MTPLMVERVQTLCGRSLSYQRNCICTNWYAVHESNHELNGAWRCVEIKTGTSIYYKHLQWRNRHRVTFSESVTTSYVNVTNPKSHTKVLTDFVNSSPPSDAYIRQWTGSALIQIMACRLFGAKPLSKPMHGYWQLDPKEQSQWNFNQNSNMSIQ